MCMLCGFSEVGKTVQIHANHRLCYYCLRKYIKSQNKGQMIVIDSDRVESKINSKDYIPVKLLKCPARNCKYRFELDVIQQIMQRREFNTCLRKALNLAKVTMETDEKQKKIKYENYSCLICCSELDEKEGIVLDCNDSFCKTCMKRFLEEEYTVGKGIHGIVCPLPGCKTQLESYSIEELVGREKFDILNQRTIRQKYKVFDCPNCGEAFVNREGYKGRELCCVTCGESMCRLCNQKYHSGICQYRSMLISNMLQTGLKVSPCPYCLQMSAKDQGCNHVTCYFCKNDFCFACSAKRNPILIHGNHYHRPSCPNYANYLGPDKYNPEKCMECKRLRKICPKPNDLIEMDIPDDEKMDTFIQ